MSLVTDFRARLSKLFPGAYTPKHDHYGDYGWPCELSFDQFYRMYCRNSLASAAVDKTVGKTWQSFPALWEAPDKPAETPLEQTVADHFQATGVWRALAQTDRRGMVGAYSAAIIRVRDGRAWDTPIERVTSIEDIMGIVPCWEAQLQVAEWDLAPGRETYGEPIMWRYDRNAVMENIQATPAEAVRVHPSRVLIWSEDGTINGRSDLEPGFNDLVDLEKIKGAGGEGFWKSSRGTPIITAPEGMTYADVQKAMGGTSPEDTKAKLDAKLDDWQSGFDKGLMLGGMEAKPLQITLPSPEYFFAIEVQSFAASMGIPYKVLIGNITGERASTEDAREWAQTCMSRRENLCIPQIESFVRRLQTWGALPDGIQVGWSSLVDATPDELLDRAGKLSTINQQNPNELVFLPDEIRETAGFASSDDVEGFAEIAAKGEDNPDPEPAI